MRGTALERARRAWQEAALDTRADVRRVGVKGQLRRLDERVQGARGKRLPTEHFGTALEAARQGVPEDQAVGHAVRALTMTYALAYEQARREAAGPRAS